MTRVGFLFGVLLLASCNSSFLYPEAAPNTGKRPAPENQSFRAVDIAKSDTDIATEAHLQESLASARLIMEKLYRRNPREWRKGGCGSASASVERAFDPRYKFTFPALGGKRGTDAILLAFRSDYTGDRVFAFGVGLASMILMSYDSKTSFYLTDKLDAQKLYNSARNVEIAAWKLSSSRDANGKLYLLANDMGDGPNNLSFEREFGKIIAYQDVMARVMAQRTNRTIRQVLQILASAAFLPL